MYAESTLTGSETPSISLITSPKDKSAKDSIYTFPFSANVLQRMQDLPLETYSSEDFINIIQKNCFEKMDEYGNRLPYDQIRNPTVFASIILNLKGEIAPRFRPMRTPCRGGGGVDYPVEHNLLSNDRQVIDLHWIYCQKLNANVIKGYQKLFDRFSPFDVQRAAIFASKAGSRNRQSNLLGLPEIQQFQLATLQSTQVKTRWKTINSYCERNQSKLKDLFTAPSARYPKDAVMASPDIHKSILIARGSPANALKIFTLMTGKEQKLKNFERYVNKLNEAGLII